MTKIEAAKLAVSVVVGFGVSKVVNGIISNNTSAEKLTEKIAIPVAGYVIGAIAADRAKEYTDAKIDYIVEKWNEMTGKTED